MTQVNVVENEPNSNGLGTTRNDHRAPTSISRILERLSPLELPEKEHFESYYHGNNT